MEDIKKIKSALVSVFHKDGLDDIIRLLHKNGVKIISTGGTKSFIESLGIECDAVENLTGYPSILGGRVKTLHPKVFGGILARRDNENDKRQTNEYDIPSIDLVIVDLYPFEDTVASGACESEIIEKIDIGGISLIRAAAKNFNDVVIVASKAQYSHLQKMLEQQGAQSSLVERKWFAKEAFGVSSAYDSAIYKYFDIPDPSGLRIATNGSMHLRYGENPHQKGAFFGDFNSMFTQIHGKEISYNNLLDIDAAVALINEFSEPTFAILKHNNACGIASRNDISKAWDDALACDPISAFGGVLIANRPIEAETAEKIDKIFFEVIIAPKYSAEALEILKSKKNRIILISKNLNLPKTKYRTVLNGILAQEADLHTESIDDLHIVTETQLSTEACEDLIFANKIVKHSKSNAIVLAKDKQLCASGIGQTSRVDSLRQAITKAKSFGFNLNEAVMASDAFFPFSDCVEIAHNEGINAVVQPGGSIRDAETIDFCNSHGMGMAITGIRHFKH